MDNNAVKLEVDDREVEVDAKSTVMDAAHKLGITIPHFCYHEKLSIAANCRMCLVEVEKSPKPLPACATPVSDGMKVRTRSELAKKAQQGVMEFLLINHPLDCPICDQGGECHLQDLAVGYGNARSRFDEKKRMVRAKSLGPLVSAEEMARCIHCTRCVRFGQEIAGIMELGMAGRGEHSQIMSFVGETIKSELSGNMIDVCPVGALTSKPFRFAARSWELTRIKSISPHDSYGSNLNIQIKNDKVVRVLPRQNEEINECWIADRDRFSYEGLNSSSRLVNPKVKKNGKWENIDWAGALELVAQRLQGVIDQFGPNSVGFLTSAQATFEEMYLTKKISVGLQSNNFDFRLRQEDFGVESEGVPWLGTRIADVEKIDYLLLIGASLRKEQPLLAARLRKASKQGSKITVLNPVDEDPLMSLHQKIVVNPAKMLLVLAQILNSVRSQKGLPVLRDTEQFGVSKETDLVASQLLKDSRKAIFLGNLAEQHDQRSAVVYLASMLAKEVSAIFGFSGGDANTVGGHLVRSLFKEKGSDVQEMLKSSLKAYVISHAEADLDFGNPQLAQEALRGADFVVSMCAFDHPAAKQYADLILPIAPFSETGGTFVNMEGTAQRFTGAVKPLGEARPAWKIIRVLGNLMDVDGFDFNDLTDVREELDQLTGDIENRLSNNIVHDSFPKINAARDGFERVGEIPIYRSDGIVRRSNPLQSALNYDTVTIGLNGKDIKALGLSEGKKVSLRQGNKEIFITLRQDDTVPEKAVRLPGAFYETSQLGPLIGQVYLQPIFGQSNNP